MASSVVALAHSTAGLIYCLSMFDHTELREEPFFVYPAKRFRELPIEGIELHRTDSA
jgi:hypothetical protein